MFAPPGILVTFKGMCGRYRRTTQVSPDLDVDWSGFDEEESDDSSMTGRGTSLRQIAHFGPSARKIDLLKIRLQRV
jgi:hypothetical protein